MGAELVDLVRAALRYRYTDAEEAASRTLPSAIPQSLRGTRERIAAELEERRAMGEWRLAAPRVAVSTRHAVSYFGVFQRDHDVDWTDALCILISVDAISDDEAETLLPDVEEKRRSFVLRQRALTAAQRGDIDHAADLASRLPADQAHFAYRDIGLIAALAGDSELYFRFAKQYAPGKDKNGMARLRSDLVSGVQQVHGWDAAVAVAVDKHVGVEHLGSALGRLARTGDLDAVDAALAGPLAGLLHWSVEANAQMTAIAESSPDRPEADHPRLGELLDRVIAIDPAGDKGTMRARDGVLFASWPAIGDEATLKRVRAALRTPNYKRELSRLARDIPRAT